ncbi:Lactation elevated protein 1 [Porphyridium purpureum]|uniref:Lactation elevated protein 1 n=1 Tax=Porphyridium purpureum TaxID=35688 RepID=A0A5J4YWD9_PORPP|nr:Lactation elevated protein 1 [Porphyridium purpureum]|eukprot:POR1749..scf209_3
MYALCRYRSPGLRPTRFGERLLVWAGVSQGRTSVTVNAGSERERVVAEEQLGRLGRLHHAGKVSLDPAQQWVMQRLHELGDQLERFGPVLARYREAVREWHTLVQKLRRDEEERRKGLSGWKKVRFWMDLKLEKVPEVHALTPAQLNAPAEPQFPHSEKPRGVFLHGAVGRGKTMCMDLFWSRARSRGIPGMRVHFHFFVMTLHQWLHEYDICSPSARAQKGWTHPIQALVDKFLDHIHSNTGFGVLCLDEFSMPDIADSRLLSLFLKELLARGTCLVTTSNRFAAEMIELQTFTGEDLQAFSALLRSSCTSLSLDGAIDYRLSLGSVCTESELMHLWPCSASNLNLLRSAWRRECTNARPHGKQPITIRVMFGRTLHIPCRAEQAAWFDFLELCDGPRSSADYVALAQVVKRLYLANVPQMSIQTRDWARRFILLIDSFYDAGSRLILASAVPVERLFDGTGHGIDNAAVAESTQFETESGKRGVSRGNRAFGMGSLYSGADEQFIFHRAVSRLKEMQSARYAAEACEIRSS